MLLIQLYSDTDFALYSYNEFYYKTSKKKQQQNNKQQNKCSSKVKNDEETDAKHSIT